MTERMSSSTLCLAPTVKFGDGVSTEIIGRIKAFDKMHRLGFSNNLLIII